jgi:hypothetical protein
MSAIFKMATKTRHKKWAKFCPVVPEICMDKFMVRGKKERRIIIIIIIIIRRNGAKTISLPNFVRETCHPNLNSTFVLFQVV